MGKTEWYVSRWICANRWRCFTFWLNEGVPYNRLDLEMDGYELVNTHTLLSTKDRGLLVSHDFEFTYGKEHGWMLVEAETPDEAWKVYDKAMNERAA